MKPASMIFVLISMFGLLTVQPAQAAPESCQEDLNAHAEKRLNIVQRINNFNKKRPTPAQACSTFSELVSVETKMIKWMEDNKDWCQLPDTLIEDIKKGNTQAIKIKGQACNAAKAAQQNSGNNAAQRPAIRLPKSAL